MEILSRLPRMALVASVMTVALSGSSLHAKMPLLNEAGTVKFSRSLIVEVNAAAKAICQRKAAACAEENCSGKGGGNVSAHCFENNCQPALTACLAAAGQ